MSTKEIKSWLSEIGRDRKWLADQCGVSISTVNGWLSANRPIPGPAAKIIERLRHGAAPELNPELTLAEFMSAQQRAKSSGLGFGDWIAGLIRRELGELPTSDVKNK